MEDKKFEQPLRLLLIGLRKQLNGQEHNLKILFDEITVKSGNEIDLWDYYQNLFFEEENKVKKDLEKYSKEELRIIRDILNENAKKAEWDTSDERTWEQKYGRYGDYRQIRDI